MMSASSLQLEAVLGCLGWRQLAAVRQVCTRWRMLKATWAKLCVEDLSHERIRDVLAVSIGPALRSFSAGFIDADLLNHLARLAPRLENIELQMLPDELSKARSSFLAFKVLGRLELECDCDPTTELDLPPSLRDLCLCAASPGMLPQTLECLTLYGVLHQPARLLRLLASDSATPNLRKVDLGFVPGLDDDFALLAERLLAERLLAGRARRSFIELTVRYSRRTCNPLVFLSAFRLEAAEESASLEVLGLANRGTVTMVAEQGRIRTRFGFVSLEARDWLDPTWLSKKTISRLHVTRCTQNLLPAYLKLDVAELWLSAWDVRTRIPSMGGTTVRQLELSRFSEVSFDDDFAPGRLKEICLDERPLNVPAGGVLSLEDGHYMLRF